MLTFGRTGRGLAALIALLIPSALAARPDEKVFQQTGDYGININDSPGARVEVTRVENRIVIESPSLFVARAIVASYDKELSEVTRNDEALKGHVQELQRRLTRYEDAYRQSTKDGVRTAESIAELDRELADLRAAITDIEQGNQEFWQSVIGRLQQIDNIENRLAAVEEKIGAIGAADAAAALDNADVETAIEKYDYINAERHGQDWNRIDIGLAAVGSGRLAEAGTAGYFRLGHSVIAYSRPMFGIGLAVGTSITIGAASTNSDRSFFFEGALQGGPWLRMGGTNNVALETYFDAPVYQYVGGGSAFPLLGVGGRLALSHEPASIGVYYRRSFSSVLTDSPDVTSTGISFSYVDSQRGFGPLNAAYKTTRDGWSVMAGTLSYRTFPSGGLTAGARFLEDKNFYPNTHNVGVGIGFEMSLMIGQEKRATDAAFLTGLSLAMGPHARFARFLQLSAHGQMELLAYSDADWKFFLPGISGEVTLIDGLSIIYKHVHASWRDDKLGDYNMLLVAVSKTHTAKNDPLYTGD
jgi:hypothetical protein